MTRQKRTRRLRELSDASLTLELETHLKRASYTMDELVAVLTSQGMAWERVSVVLREIGGHLGDSLAVCYEGTRRKLSTLFVLEPEE